MVGLTALRLLLWVSLSLLLWWRSPLALWRCSYKLRIGPLLLQMWALGSHVANLLAIVTCRHRPRLLR